MVKLLLERVMKKARRFWRMGKARHDLSTNNPVNIYLLTKEKSS